MEQSRREGTLNDHAGTLAGAFEFTDKTVTDIDVPIDAVVMLPAGASPAAVQLAVVERGHSVSSSRTTPGLPLAICT